MTKYSVFVEAKAQKQFKKLPKDDQARITNVLSELEQEGLIARIHIKKLQGYKKHYRIKTGNYRLLLEVSADQIVVYSISQRENAYE